MSFFHEPFQSYVGNFNKVLVNLMSTVWKIIHQHVNNNAFEFVVIN